jgi:hypothetical protein
MAIDPELVKAYKRTAYRVRALHGEVELRVDGYNPALDNLLAQHGVTTWAFVTAFNPASVPQPESDNLRTQVALEEIVGARGYNTLPCEAVDAAQEEWPVEKGLIIFGISPREAASLARSFGQNAILTGELGSPVKLDLVAE